MAVSKKVGSARQCCSCGKYRLIQKFSTFHKQVILWFKFSQLELIKNNLLRYGVFFAMLLFYLAGTCRAQQQRFFYSRQKMGSPFSIIFYDLDSLHANKMADEAFRLVDSLVNIFSDYIDTSELN